MKAERYDHAVLISRSTLFPNARIKHQAKNTKLRCNRKILPPTHASIHFAI